MRIGQIKVSNSLRGTVFGLVSTTNKYAALVRGVNELRFAEENIYILEAQKPQQLFEELFGILSNYGNFTASDVETDLKPIKSGGRAYLPSQGELVTIESAIVNGKECFLAHTDKDSRKFLVEEAIPEDGFMLSDLERLL